MPSHSPLTGPWQIGDFVLNFEGDAPWPSEFSCLSMHIFEGEAELLDALTIMRNAHGPMGGTWVAKKCLPYYFKDSVPEPYHCVNFCTKSFPEEAEDDGGYHLMLRHSFQLRLDKAKHKFHKQANIPLITGASLLCMADVLGPPYSWVLCSPNDLHVPDFFATNENAVWTIVGDCQHDRATMTVFAHDDNTLVMAKMLC